MRRVVALEVALAAVDAARELDDERRILYPDLVLGLLGPRARTPLEKLMSTKAREFYSDIFQENFDKGVAKGKAEGMAKGMAKGLAQGKAELLLKLLALKQIAVSEADRARILGCTDPDRLDAWAGRVLTATSLREVFGED